MKLLFTGDLHFRGTSPRNRKDDYLTAAKAKMREVYKIAVEHNAKAIITPGDVFDRPEVSISVLLDVVNLLKESPVPIYTTIGNHDVFSYNLDTYERTSLHLLEMLVPQLKVYSENQMAIIGTNDADVAITFEPYSNKIDREGYGYSPYDKEANTVAIHVAHGLLLNHVPPFDRFTLVQEVKTDADIVLTGHCHTGYGIHKRSDGKVFCNPGALMRLAASQTEIERPIQVALIDIRSKEDFDITLVPLQCAKSGEEVLDRSKIEENAARAYAMEEFAALIQTNTSEKVMLNIPDIIEQIAKMENFDPQVIQEALKKIHEQREATQ